MMVNCDMSAAYISSDGGAAWRMIHCSQLRSSTQCRPAFHPTEAKTIFAASGWSGLKVTRDLGVYWESVGNLPGDLAGEIAIDPGRPDLMLAGASREVWRSLDGGKKWTRCQGLRGAAVAFHFDQTSPAEKRICFAATAEGIWRSDDGGASWAEKSAGLPWRRPALVCRWVKRCGQGDPPVLRHSEQSRGRQVRWRGLSFGRPRRQLAVGYGPRDEHGHKGR